MRTTDRTTVKATNRSLAAALRSLGVTPSGVAWDYAREALAANPDAHLEDVARLAVAEMEYAELRAARLDTEVRIECLEAQIREVYTPRHAA